MKKDTEFRDATKDIKNKDVDVPEGIYDGTVRVVTEADVLRDPRVVAAGAVVGQLYDFSNLPYVKDNAIENDVERYNRKHAEAGISEENPFGNKDKVAPSESSEWERREMGIKNPEEKPAR